MVESVGIVGSGSPAIDAMRASAVSVSASVDETATAASISQVRPLSPSSRADPSTGVLITEFYSTDGQLKLQIPSEAAIAYLRSGLAGAKDTPVSPDLTTAAAEPDAKDSSVGIIA